MADRSDLQVPPTWGSRLIGMEGLRGLAATTVLVGHVHSHLARGLDLGRPVDLVLSLVLNGLTLFFALSGFLLFRPFAAAIISGRPLPSTSRFLQNRALRVFPAYLVILLLVCLVLGAAYTETIGPGAGIEGVGASVGYLTDPLVLLANATTLHTLFPGTIKTGLGASWSLTVELVFYLVLPALSWVAYRAARGRGLRASAAIACGPAALLLLLGVAGSLLSDGLNPGTTPAERFYYSWGGNGYAVLARSFLVHADLFAFGMVAAVVLVLVQQGVIPAARLGAVRLACVGTLLVGVAGGQRSPLPTTWWALACGALILLVALPGRSLTTGSLAPSALARVLEVAPLRYIGLISYSMYLWHLPVLWLLQDRGLTFAATPLGLVANVGLVLAVSVLVSTATYLGVEKPALRLKSRPGRGSGHPQQPAHPPASRVRPAAATPAAPGGPRRSRRTS